ncbi:MAG: glycosyltransferase family 2 protein [Spirochaetaceae bacterium]|jgi:glycosyltransferase involved in cell wall biosynthesis|nr:glycosyltransferase family 2 protein [Spirochaetaceae bacterium]
MMASLPKISVIILTYNRPHFIQRSVDSILKQDFTDFELILIDNGSTDSTNEVCKAILSGNTTARFIRREDSSIGGGRNAGLDAARGEYIAFIDDDDYAYPDMLSFLYNLAKIHGADISFCGSDKELPGSVIQPQFLFDELLVLTPEDAVIELLERRLLNLATPTKLFKKKLFERERFKEDRKYDDISTTYKLFASANRIVGHGIPKYCFNRHGGNNSGFTDNDKKLTPAQLEEYFITYRERTAWLLEKLPAISEYVLYSEWSFLLSMYRKIVSHNLINCEEQRKYCDAYLCKAGGRHLKSPWIKPFEFDYFKLHQETRNEPVSKPC